MVQPLSESSRNLDVLPVPSTGPRRVPPAAAPPSGSTLVLPARRSLERRRRRRAGVFFPTLRREHIGAAFTLLVLLGALAAMGWRVASDLQAPATTAPVAFTTIRVRPGDTLWVVARRYGPAGLDTPARIEALLRANRLPNDAVLAPGQTLRVPAGR